MRSIVGTPLYMSPQILAKQSYNNKSDLWSIGLIFYEMIYGHTPWPANNEIQLLNNIKGRSVPFDSYISDYSKDFIKKCLKIKEEERMNWDEAFKHPLLSVKIEEPAKNYKLHTLLTPKDNKENCYHGQNSRSKSKNKSTCLSRQRARTPVKLYETSNKNLTPTKVQTPKNTKHTPDRQHSPWRI